VSWPEPSEGDWDDGAPGSPLDDDAATRWPLDWRGLYPRERWLWFEQLWCDVCMLRERYRLAVRAGWWENEIQLEALAALAAWVTRYDSGEWDDPPGKLALLYDLERISSLLRDGIDPFDPRRDRAAFERHLVDLGCQVPHAPGPG
jgi:hypothetical protein